VIKGWTEVLTRMPAGSVWEVYIPEDMAYGSRDQGNIKPFSTLIFKIELISVGEK
jgi:peptidyl-prolyl cis-trans isomerase